MVGNKKLLLNFFESAVYYIVYYILGQVYVETSINHKQVSYQTNTHKHKQTQIQLQMSTR